MIDFASQVKNRMGLSHLTMVGQPDLMVEKVCVCTGSGSSLLDTFHRSGAQVFVSGDLRYHDARVAEANAVGLIDVGHFASEHIVVDSLMKQLKRACHDKGWDVDILACQVEENPFIIL